MGAILRGEKSDCHRNRLRPLFLSTVADRHRNSQWAGQRARKIRRGQNMNYREKYKRHYNIAFGPEYEVHHIDLNHKNDDIENLLLLPKDLHRAYHKIIAELCGPEDLSHFTLDFATLDPYSENFASSVGKLCSIIGQCQRWIQYKESLDSRVYYHYNISAGGAA